MNYNLLPEHTTVFISEFTRATRDAVNIGFGDISVEDYLDGNEIRSLTCTINYPLSTECTFQITLSDDDKYFYLSDIILAICNKYRDIYAEEEATSSIKEDRIPGMLNRNDTDGKWGIGLHFLDELKLSSLTLDTDTNTIYVDVSTEISPSHIVPLEQLVAEKEAARKSDSCSDNNWFIWLL